MLEVGRVFVTDETCRLACPPSRRWARPGRCTVLGPRRAAALAGVRAALTGEGAEERRTALGLGPASVAVLLSAGGASADRTPPPYRPRETHAEIRSCDTGPAA
ncbi:hypothetical protein [Streptomyces sp. NPDC001165]|uniref:hypothetical protein n=1 Tax=Streptomyces sp. NPDC001165 TaxID=3364546 RepID=UPI0036A00D8E